MHEPETYRFADDGSFPNSPLPLLIYRAALPADADVMERCFRRNLWSNSWRNGVFPFHHFHSNAHEVLGVAAGRVRVAFGGPEGCVITVEAGDVVVIPAGVAHCNRGQSPGPLIVGAYSGGAEYDLCLGAPCHHSPAKQSIARVARPQADPVSGIAGPLLRLWSC